MMRKVLAFIQILRPELPASAGVCVVLGQTIALNALPTLIQGMLGFLFGFFLSGSAMVFNDYFDLHVDLVNSPQRPLPSGRLSPNEAIVFGAATAVVAFVVGSVLNPLLLPAGFLICLLGFAYNWKLKSTGLLGNLIVAMNVAMTFIAGGISVNRLSHPMVWVFGAIAFTFDLAEEIAGDTMDMEGDRLRGSRSLAIQYGRSFGLRVSAVLFFLTILWTGIPVLLGETGFEYIIPIAVMDAILAIFTFRLLKSTTPGEGRNAMRVMYLSATLGLAAFLAAGFIR